MHHLLKTAIATTILTLSAQALAQITLYEDEGWRGRPFSTTHEVRDLSRFGFNDRAASVIVEGGQWELCDDAGYAGKCMILRPGNYGSLRDMGMSNRISSVRPISHREHYENEAPVHQEPAYEYRRRPEEEIFQAPVTSVHAEYGVGQKRCWTEREQVNEPAARQTNVGGAVVGALLGGVLGHQVGGGRGKDLATVGGAVAGAAIGSNVGTQSSGDSYSRDVQRCETVPNQTPDLWDVTYNFRGYDHRIQTRYAPGQSITVNREGEPRQ